MKKALIIGLLIIALLLAMIFYQYKDPYAGIDVAIEESEKNLYVTKLDNDFTLTVKENHNLPLVTIQIWTKVGSRNEQDDNRGIAHIFEHVWFKGTPTQPVGSFDKKIASYGGYVNAMTGQDFTTFYVIIPQEYFEQTMELLADLFKNNAFNLEEIEKEKQVILEEQTMIQNEPTLYVDEQFGLNLFLKHPYRHPIIGYTETISSATPEKIKQFYQTWYKPNNMNLVVVGDVTKQRVLESTQKNFGELKKETLPVLNIPEEPEQEEIRYKIETKKGLQNNYVALGYRTANFTDNDWYALKILSQIIDGAENSRIPLKVRKEKELITESQTYLVALKDLGAIETLVVTLKDKENEAIQAVIDEYNKFKKEYVTDIELESAKKQLQAGYALQQEEIIMQGIDIGKWWTTGNFEKQQYYLEDINKVTREDILRAANKYFNKPIIYVLKGE